MKKLFTLVALLFIASRSIAAPPQVSGTLRGFSDKWRPCLYVSRLNSLDDSYTADASLRILTVPLDTSGGFSFSTAELGSEPKLYRLYVLPKDVPVSEHLTLGPANFMILLLDNTSNAQIEVADASVSMAYKVRSNTANSAIAAYLNRFFSGQSQEGISDNDMRVYLSQTDPLVAVVAYRQLFLHDKKFSAADNELFGKLCERLGERYPDLSYTHELQQKLELYGEPANPVAWWWGIGGGVLIAVVILLVRRKKGKVIAEGTIDREKLYTLTLRERRILELLLKNYSNKELADQLHIEVSTVKTHVSSIFQKLGISSRKETVRFAHLLEKQDLSP